MAVRALNGTWDLQGSENLLPYVQAIGNNFDAVKSVLGPSNKYFQTISIDGDHVTIETSTNIHSTAFTAKLNAENEEVTLDNRKSIVSVDGGKLLHVQKWGDAVNTIVREVRDGKLYAHFQQQQQQHNHPRVGLQSHDTSPSPHTPARSRGSVPDYISARRWHRSHTKTMAAAASQGAGAMRSFYELSAKTLGGELVNFSRYRGKVVLIENVASL
ncbi:unnamed protein product [Lampetra planeri]